MQDGGLERIVSEQSFAKLLEGRAEMFLRFATMLSARRAQEWSRRHYDQLVTEADSVEALLDDYGASHNQTFAYFRELVASVRGFTLAGFSIAHLAHRLEVYPTVLTAGESSGLATSVRRSGAFLQSTIGDLLGATLAEAEALRLPVSPEPFPDSRWNEDPLRSRLPADIGQRDLSSDEHKAAELASRFVQTAREFEGRSIRPLAGEAERERWMQRNCSEEQARSLEASVHNLQSAYDTWIKGSDLESADARLPRLRGHASIALHLLEAVTQLVHFVERHERNDGDASIPRRLTGLVSRATARDVTLNLLLVPAALVITRGRVLAEDVLPSYTRLQQLELELPHDVAMHARPAALIVAVVNRHGTPVELEVDGRRCNAGSILDMMVTIGSSPDARTFRFRGDEHPLRDIALLFQSRLGENGLDSLPIGLAYLRGGT